MADMPKPPLVLYVDDERANRIVFEQSLKSEFTIKTVEDAKSALEALDREDVAVLVSDIRMPEVDGLELLRRAKERHPNTIRMVITAYSDVDPILRAINEGLVARYIVKPWDREELVQVLRWATELWNFGKDSAQLLRRLLETERLASLGGLTALYVHDLKTPIMVVNNLLDELHAVADAVPTLHAAIEASDIDDRLKARLLQRVDDTPEIVQDAKQASTLIKDMIGGLSDYIRNKGPQETPVIDPTPVIQFTVNMFQRITVENRTAQIGYRGSKSLPHVRISAVDLTQVLVNLVNNATQAVHARGEPNRHVALEARTQGDMLELQVRDDGIGMSPEVLRKIGTPWFSTRPEGTGLGIANCQRLIGRAGGRMRIESEPGVGTTVTILLPTAA
ncbi:MAG TPA: ATP-binding protein [Kofleriaceae bacterium]|nr:ATP-binding protein [Kofleriaceae bacterium]